MKILLKNILSFINCDLLNSIQVLSGFKSISYLLFFRKKLFTVEAYVFVGNTHES